MSPFSLSAFQIYTSKLHGNIVGQAPTGMLAGVVCATDDPRGRIRRAIETPTESSFTVEGMDAVLWLPRSSQTRVKPGSLIYHGPVAFCKAFHCLVASDKTTKPVRPFDSTHSASAACYRVVAKLQDWRSTRPQLGSRLRQRAHSQLREWTRCFGCLDPRRRESNPLAWFTTGRLLFMQGVSLSCREWQNHEASPSFWQHAQRQRGSLAHAPGGVDHRTIDIYIYIYLTSDSSQDHILTEGLAVLAPINCRQLLADYFGL